MTLTLFDFLPDTESIECRGIMHEVVGRYADPPAPAYVYEHDHAHQANAAIIWCVREIAKLREQVAKLQEENCAQVITALPPEVAPSGNPPKRKRYTP